MDLKQPRGIPELIEYKGWTIWGWTGWKGTKGKATTRLWCFMCVKEIAEDEPMFTNVGFEPVHWICKYPDNRPDTLHAQWVAYKGDPSDPKSCRHAYAECGDISIANIPAGEYRRGDEFEIIPYEDAITESVSEAVKERAKANGLEVMKGLISRLEDK